MIAGGDQRFHRSVFVPGRTQRNAADVSWAISHGQECVVKNA